MARVLIIDDDLMILQLLQEHLSNEGYEIETTQSANQGFDMAVKTPPDIILLDVNLPDATGFQMCGRFREHPATKLIPIFMMTGAARWPTQQAIGRSMGATEYILKPFDVINLGNRIHEVMGSKRPNQHRPAAPPVKAEETPITFDIPQIQIEAIAEIPEAAPAAPPPPPPVVEFILPPIEFTVSEASPREPEPAPAGPFLPALSPASALDVQRFFDLSVDIVILVSLLPRTRSGRHIADQLLKCGTSVGARMQEFESASSKVDAAQALQQTLKDLKETGYWLMLVRKAGLLELPSVEALEKTCRELAAILGAEPKASFNPL